VERAIAALPKGYRMVLMLHDFEGYKHGEIGHCWILMPARPKVSSTMPGVLYAGL
jgi:hypothetical protein